MDSTTESARPSSEKVFDTTREQAQKANQTMLKTADEQQKLSKDNLDAYISASRIAAQGMQQLGQAWAAYVQESMQLSAAAATALMSARSMQEVVSLQSQWARSSCEKFFAEATKLSEQTVKLTSDAMGPINQRIGVTAEKMRMPLVA